MPSLAPLANQARVGPEEKFSTAMNGDGLTEPAKDNPRSASVPPADVATDIVDINLPDYDRRSVGR